MRNIDFIKGLNRWKALTKKVRKISNPDYTDKWDLEYLYEGYAVKEAYSIIIGLYLTAKKCGLTPEQRLYFFEIVGKHNSLTRNSVATISEKISQLKDNDEYFEESELGAYAGLYSLGFNEYHSEIENLRKLQQSFSHCYFSIKGEHLIDDKSSRISIDQTKEKMREYWEYVSDDSIVPHIDHLP